MFAVVAAIFAVTVCAAVVAWRRARRDVELEAIDRLLAEEDARGELRHDGRP